MIKITLWMIEITLWINPGQGPWLRSRWGQLVRLKTSARPCCWTRGREDCDFRSIKDVKMNLKQKAHRSAIFPCAPNTIFVECCRHSISTRHILCWKLFVSVLAQLFEIDEPNSRYDDNDGYWNRSPAHSFVNFWSFFVGDQVVADSWCPFLLIACTAEIKFGW